MDVWFDSGSSWAGVLQTVPGLNFPADLYLEGSDQHRGETGVRGCSNQHRGDEGRVSKELAHNRGKGDKGREVLDRCWILVCFLVIMKCQRRVNTVGVRLLSRVLHLMHPCLLPVDMYGPTSSAHSHLWCRLVPEQLAHGCGRHGVSTLQAGVGGGT